MNTITTLYASMAPRTRALAIWAPLCLAASVVLSQNVGVVNGGTLITLALFFATGYKTVAGLID